MKSGIYMKGKLDKPKTPLQRLKKKEYEEKEKKEENNVQAKKTIDFNLLLTKMLCSIFNELLMDNWPTIHSKMLILQTLRRVVYTSKIEK